jgi:hypothetical protein
MAIIVLQPTSNRDARQHYVDTITNPVDFDQHKALLTADDYAALKEIFPSRVAPMWGVTPAVNGRNIARFQRATVGSLVLFSGDGRIFAAGTIAHKMHNPALAKTLWGEDSRGLTWEYMYVLDEIRTVDIPYAAFNEAVGYQPNFVIQGFSVLREEQSEQFLAAFDLTSQRYDEEPSDADFEAALAGLDGPQDREVRGWARREQRKARNLLLGSRPAGECRLCGRTFGREFLVAAHKKKRSKCTDDEKRDLKNIMMLCCVFGCDALYERGYVTIGVDGEVSVSDRCGLVESTYAATVMRTRLDVAEGEAAYFQWHSDRHKEV